MGKIKKMWLWSLVIILGIPLMLCGCGGDEIVVSSNTDQNKKDYKGGYTWMTMRLPWDDSFDMPFFGKGHRKESEAPEIKLNSGSDFIIYVALGSSEYMVYNVVAIRSDGEVIAAYKDPDSYRYYQRRFSISNEEVKMLRKVLLKNNAGKMLASSVDPEVNYGVQGGFTIKSSEKIRRSYFSNSWPKSFTNITEYINNKILKYNPEIKNNGFVEVRSSVITVDKEATFAVRGLINGK